MVVVGGRGAFFQTGALAAEELVEASRAEIRRLQTAARDIAEEARAHDSRAAAAGGGEGGVWPTLLMRAPADPGAAEREAAAAARALEARLRAALALEEGRLRGLVSASDTAWAAEELAREGADRARLGAAESEAAYRRERSRLADGVSIFRCEEERRLRRAFATAAVHALAAVAAAAAAAAVVPMRTHVHRGWRWW